MLAKILPFFLGIIVFLQLQIKLSVWVLLFLFVMSIYLQIKTKKTFFSLFVFFLAGMIWINLTISYLQSHIISNDLQNKPLMIQGEIISLIKQEGRLESFYMQVNSPGLQGKIKLTSYHQTLTLKPGETWQLIVKLKKPWGFANPGGFFYQDYLWVQHIIATGYIVASSKNQLIKPASLSILTIRSYLSQQISSNGSRGQPREQVAGAGRRADYTRFIQALSVGDRDNFTEQDWQVLQKTGTNHLVAISGLHIGLVAGLLFWCVQFLWRRSRVLCLLVPAQIAAAYAAIIIACVYSALAGFALPTQRAVIMLTIFMMALILRRSLVSWYPFSLALLVVLILNPLSVLDSGFYLSFFAVAALIVAARPNKKSRLFRWTMPQLIVILGVAPWTLYYFHQFSLVSPLANIITIPLVGFVIVPLCLMTCLCFCVHASGVAIIFLSLAEKVMAFAWWVLTGLSHYSFSSMTVGYFPAWKLILSLMIFFILLSRLTWIYKIFALCLFPVLCIKTTSIQDGDFKFSLLDVGQGLASVIQTRHHVLVFDTGPKFSEDFDAGSAVVVPFLQSQGISTVDMLVVSHGDSDHIGGAAAILNLLAVLSIRTSVPERFHQASYCLAGQHWQWDGVDFEFLYPDQKHLGLDNNSSCVLKISNAVGSVLSTGDIQSMAESYLVAHQKDKLSSSVLVAPHHGSKTSSSEIFLEAVRPQTVFFPVGYLNRFHFPNTVVVDRYQNLGVKMLSTADCGAIWLSFTKDKILVPVCYRQTLPFYLHY